MARNEEVRNLTSSSLVSLSPVPAPSLRTVLAVEHHQLRKFLVITDNHDVGYNGNENEKKIAKWDLRYAEPLIL